MNYIKLIGIALSLVIITCGIFSTEGPYFDSYLTRHTKFLNNTNDTITVVYKMYSYNNDMELQNFIDNEPQEIMPLGSDTFSIKHHYSFADEDKKYEIYLGSDIDTIVISKVSIVDTVIIVDFKRDVVEKIPGCDTYNGDDWYNVPNNSIYNETITYSGKKKD